MGEMASGTVPSVEVIQARYGSLPLQERLSGIIRAKNQVIIYPEIAAPILKVVAENGDFIKEGAPLVYLRDSQFKEQLQQAEASLLINQAEAKRTEANLREIRTRLDRTRQLAGKQFQSEQELETLEAQVDASEATYEQALGRIAQAEAQVQEQREALRRTVVRAPISGYVGQRNAEVGMRASTGEPLYILGDFDVVRVEVSITDEMIKKIRQGQTALLTLEGEEEDKIEAKVSRISPFLEAGSFSAAGEIDVPNKERRLRPGMFIAVDILYGESEQATLVPISTLYEDPNTGRMGVFIASSLQTETPLAEPATYDPANPPPLTEPTPMTFKEIEVIARGTDLAGISGVQPGDWVVTVGQNLLRTNGGQPVQARVRPMTWSRVADLQQLQDQDLLVKFMEKQQRLAPEVIDAQKEVATSEGSAGSAPAAADKGPNP